MSDTVFTASMVPKDSPLQALRLQSPLLQKQHHQVTLSNSVMPIHATSPSTLKPFMVIGVLKIARNIHNELVLDLMVKSNTKS
jgi:hypothetical protein